MTAPPKWHVYVGTEVGLLKGVDTENKKFSNLNSLDGLCKGDEITAMCWEDSKEEKVYIGRKNQVVQTFDCATQSFSEPRSYRVGEGAIKGIYQFNNQLVTAVESGIVKLWDEDNEQNILIDTKSKLSKMTPNPFVNSQVATGGEENDLKVWDLQTPNSPVFRARNVPNDFLDLRVPVWVTDMKFKSANNIVTCTRHHQIRLYDTRAQRRPVIDMEFERYPLMCLSLSHNDNQVVVGSSRGRMVLIDLRRKLLVHAFKGFAGSIRSVHCHPTLPLVASCGLDRFLRIHDLNLHRLLKKIYLKTRLNCLLYRTDLSNPSQPTIPPAIKNVKEVVVDAEEEGIWNAMPVLKEQHSVKRPHRIDTLAIAKKKRRKKTAVS